ncbi:centrosomal protein 43 [Anabrus simplex]|uniref:centrosomal protein 43 n=1 Tax=Anabrus simplex TaxID=316456 RepID=UPI0035A34955
MATEEETELRDLVAQTLENNGVLSKIRAQLRASVFLALEEQELAQDKIPFINKSFKDFLKTSEGSLVACLVREFLEFFELDFTLSVFDPETYHGKDYDYGGRSKLIKDLKIKNLNDTKGPLLAQILQLVRVAPKEVPDTVPKEEPSFNKTVEKRKEFSFSSAESSSPITSKTLPNPDPAEGKQSSVWDASSKPRANTEDITKHITTPSTVQDGSSKEKKTSETKSQGSVGSLDMNHSAFMSLSNLPPLRNTQPKEKDWKSLMNGLEENNYDEDFHSTASGSAVGKSDSEEIEEELASGIEDLLSNASGVEELTVDATLSNLSGLADYMENV